MREILDRYLEYEADRLEQYGTRLIHEAPTGGQLLMADFLEEFTIALDLLRVVRSEIASAPPRTVLEAEYPRRERPAHRADVISVISTDGIIRFESGSALPVLGYTPQELVGNDVFDYIHPADRSVLRQTLALMRSIPRRRVDLEFRLRHREGSWCRMAAEARHLDLGKGHSYFLCRARVTEIENRPDRPPREGSFFRRYILADGLEM